MFCLPQQRSSDSIKGFDLLIFGVLVYCHLKGNSCLRARGIL